MFIHDDLPQYPYTELNGEFCLNALEQVTKLEEQKRVYFMSWKMLLKAFLLGV